MAGKSRGNESGNGSPEIIDSDDAGSTGRSGNTGGQRTTPSGLIIIEPAAIGDNESNGDTGNSDTGQPKRRGRKPGSRNRAKTSPALDLNGVESLLFSTHQILAAVVSTPQLALDQKEAHELSEAIANVSRHYDVAISEKALDWSRLFMACGMIYGTRIFAIREARKTKRAPQSVAPEPSLKQPDNIVNIPGVGQVKAQGI